MLWHLTHHHLQYLIRNSENQSFVFLKLYRILKGCCEDLLNIWCTVTSCFQKPAQVKTENQETENLLPGRYNLRRRKGQGDEPLEQKKAKPIVLMATPQETSKTPDLEFGGRIGKRPVIIFCSCSDLFFYCLSVLQYSVQHVIQRQLMKKCIKFDNIT